MPKQLRNLAMPIGTLFCVLCIASWLSPGHSLPSVCSRLPLSSLPALRNAAYKIDDAAIERSSKHFDASAINLSAGSTSSFYTQPSTDKKNMLNMQEMPKFLALSSMMLLIVYIFTIARDTKDALIVTNCGAEAIAFLKVYGVVPAASVFLWWYATLAAKCSPAALFYATMAPFIAFYFLFAFVLYPLRHILHPMSMALPQNGLSYAVNLLRHWTFALYYIVSELWGSAGIPLLFWTCANDVVRVDQVSTAMATMLYNEIANAIG
jgi:ATP/ADP translocase